ncbi:hypothetical protein [Blastococcus sp. CT_GayMR16]|uniref:hypothetical protein n=1 Tax=Blastococcus sp. CT_GayMR16 TaxID=2559607 RepID=UPI0010732420|nr:hypothetical protein [Blastococcus sp. CT_GayMR16]TFV87234.1 hypothetical protein E4P38_14900 [Blastococcus sp. CT_GayMR16]
MSDRNVVFDPAAVRGVFGAGAARRHLADELTRLRARRVLPGRDPERVLDGPWSRFSFDIRLECASGDGVSPQPCALTIRAVGDACVAGH